MRIEFGELRNRPVMVGVLVAACALAGCGSVAADDQVGEIFSDSCGTVGSLCPLDCRSLSDQATLFGDMGDLRPELAEHGITTKNSATLFYQGIARGGKEEAFQFGGGNDYYLTADGHKLGLWQGLLIDLHGETRYGEDVNGLTGAISPANTALLFPVPGESVTALTGLKFTQIVNEHLVTFAGKINVVDGYLNPFAAGKCQTQFMNTSFVFPLILGRTVPYSSLGAGFAIMQGPEPVFSLMVMDPVNNPTTSGFEQFFENGVSLFGELSRPVKIAERPGHQQLIFSWSNRTVTALDGAAYIITPEGPVVLFEQQSHSWSLVYAFDQYLVVDPCDPTRGWGVFGQFGLSDGNPNPIRSTMTFGVSGSSPLRSRPRDTFGVGYYFMQTSTALQETLVNVRPVGNEQGVELFYNIGVTPWFHVTPDVQFIEPSGQAADAAVAVGVRTRIEF